MQTNKKDAAAGRRETPARLPGHMLHTAKNALDASEAVSSKADAKAAALFNRLVFSPIYVNDISPVLKDIRAELAKGTDGSKEKFRALKERLAAAQDKLAEEIGKIDKASGDNNVFVQMSHFARSAASPLLTYLPLFEPKDSGERMGKARQWVMDGCDSLDGLFAFYAEINPKKANLAGILMGSANYGEAIGNYKENAGAATSAIT